jgi:hypothetical protein
MNRSSQACAPAAAINSVAADALRAGSYPLRPFLTFRMPALAMIESAMPLWAALALLYALARRGRDCLVCPLRPAFQRPCR